MKNILMFCVKFFGYENRLANALRNQGYEVDLIDERPSNGFVAKSCIRFNISAYRKVVREYYERIIQDNKDKQYNYIFVVKGEAVNEEVIAMLREAYPNAKFVLYLWDSVTNIPDCEKRMKLYDRVLTFDPMDAENYSLPYLSIPYDENAFRLAKTEDLRYDVSFIGTAHSVRPRVVKQIVEQCELVGRKCFLYFYSPHILVYMFNKLTNPNYRWLSLKEVHFKPLSSEQVNEIYAVSGCVLDIEHPKQSGATTRPVEMLPMRKKIITTNVHVKDFPFFNENNFYIIDRDNPVIDERFLNCKYTDIDDSIVQKYSPAFFVQELMGEGES